jgi:hypothetical protein
MRPTTMIPMGPAAIYIVYDLLYVFVLVFIIFIIQIIIFRLVISNTLYLSATSRV